MVAAILNGHVTRRGLSDGHVTSMTNEQDNLGEREKLTKDLYALIEEN